MAPQMTGPLTGPVTWAIARYVTGRAGSSLPGSVTITEGVTFLNALVLSASLIQIRFAPEDLTFGGLNFNQPKAGGYVALTSIGVN